MIIWGAGLAGLLAGTQFQTAEIYEAGPQDQVNHKAVLRFRSSAVGDAVGIPFRKVTVHKGIWIHGQQVEPTIKLANWYSKKVIGRLADRSIWNLMPAERFIAPPDFHAQLAERCNGRIHFNRPVTMDDVPYNQAFAEPIISTLPMPVMMKLFDAPGRKPDSIPTFNSSGIQVARWHVPNADVFQTIYFPNPETRLYRASITGDLLIAEYMNKTVPEIAEEFSDEGEPFSAFGLSESECEQIDQSTFQRYGKISEIDDAWRKQFMFRLTQERNIFSLGRFATWRNILLDDVLHDIAVIKKLMNAGIYDRAKIVAH